SRSCDSTSPASARRPRRARVSGSRAPSTRAHTRRARPRRRWSPRAPGFAAFSFPFPFSAPRPAARVGHRTARMRARPHLLVLPSRYRMPGVTTLTGGAKRRERGREATSVGNALRGVPFFRAAAGRSGKAERHGGRSLLPPSLLLPPRPPALLRLAPL